MSPLFATGRQLSVPCFENGGGGSRGGVVGVKKNEYLGTQSFYCIYLPGELTMFLVKNVSLYMTLSAQFQMLILVSLFS